MLPSGKVKEMAETLMQRVVEALPFLDKIAEDVQPKVQEAVEAGGTRARNVLDGVWLEAPLHLRWARRCYRKGVRKARCRRLARFRDPGSVRGRRDRALRLAVPGWRVEAYGSGARASEHDRARP
jgi:hypothetical protein